MASKPPVVLQDSPAFDQFLLKHGLVTDNRLQFLKNEASEKQVPLATLLHSYGLIDGIQSKWEDVFRKTQWAKYPSEEMIRFVARTYSHIPNRSDIHFLDLGCGIGTCSWYLAKEGYRATSVDCSPTAIEFGKEWFALENLNSDFQVGLMQSLPFENASFDCVIDNSSSTSMPFPVIQQILAEAKRVLKPGSRYYGMFLGDETTIEGKQNPNSPDPKFYEDVTDGPIKRVATVRLLNREEIDQLFQYATDVTVDCMTRTVGGGPDKVQSWHVSAIL